MSRPEIPAAPLIVLVALLCVLLPCCRDDPPDFRLLPGRAVSLAPLFVPEAGMVRLGSSSLQDEELPCFTLFDQSRAAIPLPIPSTFTATVELPDTPAAIDFGLTLKESLWRLGAPPVRLRVSARTGGGRWTELHTLQACPANRDDHRRWLDARIPLEGFAGRRLQLRFSVDAAPMTPDQEAVLDCRPLLIAAPVVFAEPEPGDTANVPVDSVVLVLIDTLRAGHLGCYGHDRHTSPHIDRLARQGVLFRRVLAQASWTVPSVASLFTGVTPSRHGVHKDRSLILRPNQTTLAEALQSAGLATISVTANGLVGPRTGMHQGFEVVDLHPSSARRFMGAATVLERSLYWLHRVRKRPFFLYVHFIDPHGPYTPPATFNLFADPPPAGLDERVLDGRVDWAKAHLLRTGRSPLTPDELDHLLARYDGEIRLTDYYVGRLLADIARQGLSRRTIVIVTADHGEEFLDHGGFAHGSTLYQELVDVPLVIRDPYRSAPGRQVSGPVMLADLPATIFASLGLALPEVFPGRDLLGESPSPPGRFLYAEMMPTRQHPDSVTLGQGKRSVVRGPWKLIRNLHTGRVSLYNLDSDPGELSDLYDKRPDVAVELEAVMNERLAGEAPTTPEQREAPTPEQEEMLRALGYVE